MENDLDTLKRQFETFLDHTEEARRLSERDRDYKDHKQWSEEEVAKLRMRNQAPVVINRIHPKVEGLKGLLVQRNTDPKAFPRTKKHEKAAEAITDALRFVADNNDFDHLKIDVADNVFVEGYGAVIVGTKKKRDVEIKIEHIPWDRFYYDSHSRRQDFADARYMGIVSWLGIEEAKEKFNLSDDEADEILGSQGALDDTFEDRPRWVDTARKRIRVCQHFYIHKGVWGMAFFTADRFLIPSKPSPFLDDEGNPTNPIVAASAHVDRDNNRYGEVRYWIDLQDEINHRRSKALHLLSVRQTKSRKGAIKDIAAMKRELAKPNGHVEYDGEEGDFDLLPTTDMAQAQFNLLVDAKQELDSVGFNAQLAGERSDGELSGKAILALQQAGTIELSATFNNLNDWEKRVYRQIWYRIRQFWDREKWIRVLDDEKNLRWVGLNTPITVQQALEERINDESQSLFVRKRAAQMFTQMMQAQDPRLEQVIEVRNNVAELDVDIILEQALDTVNVQQEQFELLAKLAQGRPEIPFTALLKLSTLRDKEQIIEDIEQAQQQAGQLQAQAAQQEMADKEAERELKEAKTAGENQKAVQTHVETQLLLHRPIDSVTAAV